MKINFLKIKKVYKKESFKINSSIYWNFLVVFALLVMIISFVFAYELFLKTSKEDVQVNTFNNMKIGNKEKEKIGKALEYFSEREKKSVEILNSPVPVVDPSI